MKKFFALLIAVLITSVAVPVFADDMKATKDECLLASKNCRNEVDTIQMKIKKLQAEIKKGKKVYTADELKNLEAKLKETDELLDNMLRK